MDSRDKASRDRKASPPSVAADSAGAGRPDMGKRCGGRERPPATSASQGLTPAPHSRVSRESSNDFDRYVANREFAKSIAKLLWDHATERRRRGVNG